MNDNVTVKNDTQKSTKKQSARVKNCKTVNDTIQAKMKLKKKYEEQMQELEDKEKELREAARNDYRKNRNHALCFIGGLVVSCFENNWREFDVLKFYDWTKRNKEWIKSTWNAEVVDPVIANERFRKDERSIKNEQKQIKEQAQPQPQQQTAPVTTTQSQQTSGKPYTSHSFAEEGRKF